jgi:alkanesulfonate monooxygenase SsuD/methylene tetrahydromethanopterin reductase-like flavin-dependent oxidoreductase (luciferase family)
MMKLNLGRVGIWSVELRLADPGEIGERAAELDELGFGTLWIPGLGGGDTLGDAERLLAGTGKITVATGVVSIWRHDAADMAAGHQRLADAYGRRLLLGLGVSDPGTAHRAGRPFRPLADMGEYLDRLDQADRDHVREITGTSRRTRRQWPRLARTRGRPTEPCHQIATRLQALVTVHLTGFHLDKIARTKFGGNCDADPPRYRREPDTGQVRSVRTGRPP